MGKILRIPGNIIIKLFSACGSIGAITFLLLERFYKSGTILKETCVVFNINARSFQLSQEISEIWTKISGSQKFPDSDFLAIMLL